MAIQVGSRMQPTGDGQSESVPVYEDEFRNWWSGLSGATDLEKFRSTDAAGNRSVAMSPVGGTLETASALHSLGMFSGEMAGDPLVAQTIEAARSRSGLGQVAQLGFMVGAGLMLGGAASAAFSGAGAAAGGGGAAAGGTGSLMPAAVPETAATLAEWSAAGTEIIGAGAAVGGAGSTSRAATPTSAASGLSGMEMLLAAQAAPTLLGLAAGGSEMPAAAGAAAQDMDRRPSTANRERAMELRRAAAERAASAAGAKRFKNEADLLGQTGRTTERRRAGQQRVVLGY